MTPTLVACSHGTSDPRGQETVRRLVAAIIHAVPDVPVAAAVVDVEDHRLEGVLDRIEGPAIVVPLLLSAGFHVHHDIARAVAARPGVLAAAPLGPSAALAAAGARRLREVGAEPRDVVVLAASGSSDERAMSDVETAARLLQDAWGAPVLLGHVGHRGTPLDDVVAGARATHPGARIVASSYLLAPGHFQDQVAEAGADLVTAPLVRPSPDAGIVTLVARRFTDALRTTTRRER